MWFIFPAIILTIGLLGLYLNIKAYKKGQTISLKKLIVTVMFIFLGGGVFLQKMKIIDNEQLEQLLLAFDTDAREEKERLKLEEAEKAEAERKKRQKELFKKMD